MRFIPSPQHQDQLQGPTSLIFNRNKGPYPRCKAARICRRPPIAVAENQWGYTSTPPIHHHSMPTDFYLYSALVTYTSRINHLKEVFGTSWLQNGVKPYFDSGSYKVVQIVHFTPIQIWTPKIYVH